MLVGGAQVQPTSGTPETEEVYMSKLEETAARERGGS